MGNMKKKKIYDYKCTFYFKMYLKNNGYYDGIYFYRYLTQIYCPLNITKKKITLFCGKQLKK